MKTATLLLIGAGVVAGGAGIVLLARSAKADDETPRKDAEKKGKPKGKGKGKPKGKGKKPNFAPKRVNPKPVQKPPKSAPGKTGAVFSLTAAQAKTMACDLRDAENVRDVEAVYERLMKKIEASGAREVDLRSSGLTDAKVPVGQFEKEAKELLQRMRMLPQFLWGQAQSRIRTALSSLPDCDAPMKQWQALFGEAGGLQAAVRLPPFTLLQGIRPLEG